MYHIEYIGSIGHSEFLKLIDKWDKAKIPYEHRCVEVDKESPLLKHDKFVRYNQKRFDIGIGEINGVVVIVK